MDFVKCPQSTGSGLRAQERPQRKGGRLYEGRKLEKEGELRPQKRIDLLRWLSKER